jgi:hypothetical protein
MVKIGRGVYYNLKEGRKEKRERERERDGGI